MSIEDARVGCWQYIEAKHRISSAVIDEEDRIVRALICILYEDPWTDERAGRAKEAFAEFVQSFDHAIYAMIGTYVEPGRG
jgi:hypothetical protein